MPPDYYFDQIDWLTAFQRGKAWDWVELRPQTLCGFAPGTAMSILPAIAVYAAICKELGLPLRFPGQARRLRRALPGDGVRPTSPMPRCGPRPSRAAAWRPSTSPTATISAGRTCGRGIAQVFDMPAGESQTISLTQHMADKAELWRAMTKKYGLQADPLRRSSSAGRSPTTCSAADWDVMSDVTKIRRIRLPRRGRQRGDVRAPAAPLPPRKDRALITRLDPGRYRRTPWKNGGGVTRRHRRARRVWRFGRTPITAPGPFSDYSGFDRLQVLVAGQRPRAATRPTARSTCARRSGRCALPARRRS